MTIPGSDFVNGGVATKTDFYSRWAGVGINNRSVPKTVTITVTQVNDAPLFPAFGTVNLTEDEAADNVAVTRDIYAGSNIEIYPSQLTALDETFASERRIAFAAVNVPAGMFAATPTLTRDGYPNLRPNPDVFGFVHYDVTVTR